MLRYLARAPQREYPPDVRLVHNFYPGPHVDPGRDRPVGLNGFRGWITDERRRRFSSRCISRSYAASLFVPSHGAIATSKGEKHSEDVDIHSRSGRDPRVRSSGRHRGQRQARQAQHDQGRLWPLRLPRRHRARRVTNRDGDTRAGDDSQETPARRRRGGAETGSSPNAVHDWYVRRQRREGLQRDLRFRLTRSPPRSV